MARKQRNILDFCKASHSLFAATTALAAFAIIIGLLNGSSSQSLFNGILPSILFSVLGIVSALGFYNCRKLFGDTANKEQAIMVSNRIHRCQLCIVILLFVFWGIIGLVFSFSSLMNNLQDAFGGNHDYLSTKMIVQIILSGFACLLLLIRYIEIIVTSDITRKDFSDSPKTTQSVKKTIKAPEKRLEVAPDDSDEDDL